MPLVPTCPALPYILLLRSADLDNAGRDRPLPDGAICLVKDEKVPRLKWNLVRVLKGRPGRDNVVRTYNVRFANGYETRKPAQLLVPLEIPDSQGSQID